MISLSAYFKMFLSEKLMRPGDVLKKFRFDSKRSARGNIVMRWPFFLRRNSFMAIEFGVVAAMAVAFAGNSFVGQNPGDPYSIHGICVEGSTNAPPCPCALLGTANGCKELGAIQIASGVYQNADLSGARIAWAMVRGQWVKLFVDGRDSDQKAAAEAFARAAFKDYGPVRWVRQQHIDVYGKGGDFLVSVDNGRVLQLETEPTLGGDGRTPLVYSNTRDPLNPTLCQGRALKGNYNDGEDSFWMERTNAYFNENMLAGGKI